MSTVRDPRVEPQRGDVLNGGTDIEVLSREYPGVVYFIRSDYRKLQMGCTIQQWRDERWAHKIVSRGKEQA